MKTPQELLRGLEGEPLFKSWQKEHGKGFLTHFFCAVSSQGQFKSAWEIGFYNPQSQKMTIFAQATENSFEIKPEDDVFKKPTDAIEPLKINEVKIKYEDALRQFQQKSPEEFPKEVLSDGFIIVQTLQGKTVWNFTFITKALKFVNLKINAETGKIEDKQIVELIDKGTS
ncbi:PepSY domain-containing protein [Candidatus Woesearchaeota archaeon]|nr:PepSY domain-containing protein [Candidatus Woesearchaeota archaeon]